LYRQRVPSIASGLWFRVQCCNLQGFCEVSSGFSDTSLTRTGQQQAPGQRPPSFPDWHYDHDAPELRADEIAVKWRQGGTHTGTLALEGMEPVAATGKKVSIPEQFFFYRVRDDLIVEIRPDPIPDAAPQGILEQIGAKWPA
jgi:hypothetical protein